MLKSSIKNLSFKSQLYSQCSASLSTLVILSIQHGTVLNLFIPQKSSTLQFLLLSTYYVIACFTEKCRDHQPLPSSNFLTLKSLFLPGLCPWILNSLPLPYLLNGVIFPYYSRKEHLSLHYILCAVHRSIHTSVCLLKSNVPSTRAGDCLTYSYTPDSHQFIAITYRYLLNYFTL